MASTSQRHSGLYEGRVSHHRLAGPGHRFTYRLAMCYLDLEETDEVLSRHPLWSTGRLRPVRFCRADYLGPVEVPLVQAVGDVVEGALGTRPTGPVRLLTHLRTWGWCFNPISLYFCFDTDGTTLLAVVVEVTNTPWGERQQYVLAANADGVVDTVVDKAMHVSPFLSMAQRYRFEVTAPAETLSVRARCYDGDALTLDARLALRRRAIATRSMTGLLLRYPLMTLRVSASIYFQAFVLWIKGAHFHSHPARQGA
jgi:DUF1365 family protein